MCRTLYFYMNIGYGDQKAKKHFEFLFDNAQLTTFSVFKI